MAVTTPVTRGGVGVVAILVPHGKVNPAGLCPPRVATAPGGEELTDRPGPSWKWVSSGGEDSSEVGVDLAPGRADGTRGCCRGRRSDSAERGRPLDRGGLAIIRVDRRIRCGIIRP